MKNLQYSDLKIQPYLKINRLSLPVKRLLFKWRTRMAKFGGNYRGGMETPLCPLCESHLDNQMESNNCPNIKKQIKVKEDLRDIFSDNITNSTIETIIQIDELRKTTLETTE